MKQQATTRVNRLRRWKSYTGDLVDTVSRSSVQRSRAKHASTNKHAPSAVYLRDALPPSGWSTSAVESHNCFEIRVLPEN